jgi:uncharacterized protein
VRYEWDLSKNLANQEKHGISFSEAAEVFEDPLHLSILDERFGYFEERWITLGQVKARRLVVVVNLFFTKDGEEVVRIISAREATKNEHRQYEEF